jgi:hypothetical protein
MQELTPQQRAIKAGEDYTNALLSSTHYSGNTDANTKIFSASSLGNDMLQTYYSWKYGKKDKEKFGANTVGTIYQLGCDAAIDKFNANADGSDDKVLLLTGLPRYESALRVKRQLSNGWTVSGEMDHVDHKLKVIIDNKVISNFKYKDIMKNLPDNDYNIQLGVYKWLLEPTYGEYEAILAIVNKGGAAVRNDIYTLLHLNVHPTDIIEEAFINETNQLQFYIDNDIVPPQCDINKYGKTKDVPNRCALYCEHNVHCKYYSPYRRDMDIIASLI